jgi:hypothetical protein
LQRAVLSQDGSKPTAERGEEEFGGKRKQVTKERRKWHNEKLHNYTVLFIKGKGKVVLALH